jgi:potassium voltage-gated channel Eag-related subfamily H protein 8
MERMVNDRLIFILEKENLLAPAQCGFRRHRSAVDHLILLERQIQNCFVLHQQLVTVFFDLEKAYDTTWRFGIPRALHGWKFRGHLAFFISNFLQDRRFRVRLVNVLSMSNVQENGVPQGSVLSVTLRYSHL